MKNAGLLPAAIDPFDGGYDAAGEKLAYWPEKNGYAFAGNLRGHVITSPDDESNPEK
jgi:hypothetical protein